VLKMNVNDWPWARSPLSQTGGVLLLVLVWTTSSRLVQRTLVPAAMVISAGWKVLCTMFTTGLQGRFRTALCTILAIWALMALLFGLKYLPGHGSPAPPQVYPLSTWWQ